MRRILLMVFLIVVLSLSGCVAATSIPTPTKTPKPVPIPTSTPNPYQGIEGFPWWNNTVFYEIFVRSFRDSNGDGIGDFNGITQELDYLQKLGIKGIWLMPINPSPSYHGYDVTDYYAVNPDYGTLDDFKHLLNEAHKRDIKVIMDLVLNHTSAQHPWFQQALNPDSPFHDWYKWSDTDPGTLGPWGEQTWYKASNGQYYYAVFWDQMPDLNYDNPAVREESKKITSFWLKEVGVDGFRLDGARYLVEDAKLADSPANHAFFKDWAAYYRTINPLAFSVGEVWTDNYTVSSYLKDNTEFNSAFNFDLASSIVNSINGGNNSTLNFTVKATVKLFPDQDTSNFLTNHDMNRTMSQFAGDVGKAKAAAGILFTAPGIPFVYYGEEIGMSGAKPDEMIRTPMQWTGDHGAGFTDGTPWEPINTDASSVNVAQEMGNASSMLEYYRNLIQLHNEHPALQVGYTYVAESNSNKLISYLRTSSNEAVLVVINIGREAVTDYKLDLPLGPLSGQYTLTSLFGKALAINPLKANDKGGFDGYTPIPELPPYSVYILQLKPQ